MQHTLDVRFLQPPEPMELILAELEKMTKQDWLCVRHRRDPFPLYEILRESGYKWCSEWVGDEIKILIWHEDNEINPEKMHLC